MVDYVPVEKAMPIRQPSTANLMIDSADRNATAYPSAGNFFIQKNQSLMNGFFTRIGMTEIVMNWSVPNIRTGVNDSITVAVGAVGSFPLVIPQGVYTVANVLAAICATANTQVGIAGVSTFSAIVLNGECYIQCVVIATGAYKNLTWSAGTLQAQLGITPGVAANFTSVPPTANIQLYKYLDITSPELTYAQNLKDSSTSASIKTVICRWYFAFDNPPLEDPLGFAILPGYQSLQLRRLYNPPKQIKWETNLPIGNLSFQVYDPLGNLITSTAFEYLMTLQVSES
jgi:hypothetical protein